MPKISVIVPVHNVASCLEESVRSIVNQDFKDIEIILVENGSTDGSAEICKRLCKEDPRMRMLVLDGMGLSLARNAGIDAARADVVCFFDSDDIVEKEMLSAMYSAMSKYEADIVSCNYVLEMPDGEQIFNYSEDGSVTFYDKSEFLKNLFIEKICSSACPKLYRKALFDKVRFPEGRYFEDHAVMYRVIAGASRGGVHIAKSFYHYIRRDGSICSRMTSKKYYDFALANAERILFIGEYSFPPHISTCDLAFRDCVMFKANLKGMIRTSTTDEEKKNLDSLFSLLGQLIRCRFLSPKTRADLLKLKILRPYYQYRYSPKSRH